MKFLVARRDRNSELRRPKTDRRPKTEFTQPQGTTPSIERPQCRPSELPPSLRPQTRELPGACAATRTGASSTANMQTTLAVIGAGRCSPAEAALAEEVGRLIAQAGATLVCGGLGGVMEAACRGARSAGGLTVGILPGLDRAGANPWVELALPTGLGETRNTLVVRAAQAVIAIGGEYGTLSEIGFALRTRTPVFGLGTWQLARHGRLETHFHAALDAAEAVRLALASTAG